MRRWLAALVLGALTLAVVAGCGKSKPNKAQYLARANAVCSVENKGLKKLAEGSHSQDVLIKETLRIREKANRELRAIPIPTKERVPAEWLHARTTAIAEARKIFAAGPGSPKGRAAAKAYNRLEGEAIRIALAYRLRSCLAFATT